MYIEPESIPVAATVTVVPVMSRTMVAIPVIMLSFALADANGANGPFVVTVPVAVGSGTRSAQTIFAFAGVELGSWITTDSASGRAKCIAVIDVSPSPVMSVV